MKDVIKTKYSDVLWGYQDSKSFIVEAYEPDAKRFFAWRNKDGSITSLEEIAFSYPPVTVVSHANIEKFAEAITWHDWILEGVKDEELKKLIEVKK